MKHRDEDEKPWNEAQWEAFMNRADLRSERYGEILEAVEGDPNADEIIAREMGWHQHDEDEDPEEKRRWIEEMNAAAASVTEEEIREFSRRRDEELNAIPAYKRGFEFGMMVHNAIKDIIEKASEDDAELLGDAMLGAHLIAAKIAGGHGMGCEDDVLCGNIVNCKRGLAGADKCLKALHKARERGLVPAAVADALLAEGEAVRRLVEEHIAGLRKRVWWA